MTYTLDTTTAAKKAGIKSQRELAKLLGVAPFTLTRLKTVKEKPYSYVTKKRNTNPPHEVKWLKTAYLIRQMVDVPFVQIVQKDLVGNYSFDIPAIRLQYVIKNERFISNDELKLIPANSPAWIGFLYNLCTALNCDVTDIIKEK